MSQHEIFQRLKISRHCTRRTIRKFDELRMIATKSGVEVRSKLTDRQKQAIKLQHILDNSLSLTDFVRYFETSLKSGVSHRTLSHILHGFAMVSYIASRQPRINHEKNVLVFVRATNI